MLFRYVLSLPSACVSGHRGKKEPPLEAAGPFPKAQMKNEPAGCHRASCRLSAVRQMGDGRYKKDPADAGSFLGPLRRLGTRPGTAKGGTRIRWKAEPLLPGGAGSERLRSGFSYSRVSSACLKSAMTSSGSSRPTLMRTRPSEMPAAASSSEV